MNRSRSPLRAAAVVASVLGMVIFIAAPAIAEGGMANDSRTASAWEPIGPNGQAGAIAVAPGAPNLAVLIPSYGVGPWFTDDAGTTWHQLPDPLGVRNLRDANRVIIDPVDPLHWWYAGTALESTESVVLETSDGGRTWGESARFAGELLAFLPHDGESGFVVATTTGATTAAIHTRDDTDTWASQSIDTGSAIRKIMASGDALVLGGHFAAWRLIPDTDSAPVEIYRVNESNRLAVEGALSAGASDAPASQERVNQIWDMTTTPSVLLVKELGRGIVGSLDAGVTWTDWVVPHDVTSISSDGDAFYLLRSGPGPRWVDVTTDAGASFTPLRIPDDGAAEHQFTTWADGSITSANPSSGLYRTTDNGQRWERIGVQGTSGLDVLVQDGLLFAGTEYGLASTSLPAAAQEWGPTGGEARVGTATAELATAGAGQLIWKAVNAPFNALDVYSSADGGRTWDTRTSVFGEARELMVHPANPDLVILSWQLATKCGLHITDDGGRTWTTTLGDCFDAAVGDPSNPDRVWLGGRAGLFRSDDGGSTGTRVSDIPATTILLDAHRIVIGGDKLHTSEDGGVTFTASTQSASSASTTGHASFTSLVRSGPRLFAGYTTGSNTATSGVLISSDGGSTWTEFSTDLENSEVLSLAIGSDGNTLFAGTRNGGVHSTPLPPRVSPTATADTAHTSFGEPVPIDVLSNDSGGDLRIDPSTVLLQSDKQEEWTPSLETHEEGEFKVDPTSGIVTFTPDPSFSGTTSTVNYRFANTDGEIAHAKLTVVVDSPTAPGDGSGSGSGSGEQTSDTSDANRLATTGANPFPFIAIAGALLAAGTALAIRTLLRRHSTNDDHPGRTSRVD